MKNLPQINVLALEGVSILEQLRLEEALLRSGDQNFCILNHKSSPAIVMGISGKEEELIDEEEFSKRPVSVIRRFSGGGCVLINQETLFLTFICNRKDIDIGTCPKALLSWTEKVLMPCFLPGSFQVRENDYVLGDKKFGGNAQYFTKDRWLHHTSILWDFSDEEMRVLKMPPKIPDYREGRSHKKFLIRLKEHFSSKDHFFENVIHSLSKSFQLQKLEKCDVEYILKTPHRKATEILRNHAST